MNDTDHISPRPLRVLHCVGHLLRGGIEKWLFQTLPPQLVLQCEHHIMVRTANEESFTQEFRTAGIPVLVCANFANPLRFAREFRRLLRENGPYDILHVHGSSFSGLLALLLAKPFGLPHSIVHSHNDVRPLLRTRGHVYRAYVKATLKAYRGLADFGFATSILAAESMFGMRWKAEQKYEVLYCGIDCKPFERPRDPMLRTALGLDDDEFVIGHIGRFHEQKNHSFVVDVVEAAIAMQSNVRCLMIGDGPLRESIVAEVGRRNLRDRFLFIADTTAPADYMTNAMDCLILPSKYEGLGLVAVEAQAAGLPCLVSDRVPDEAIVDRCLVQVLPLERTATEWARTILALGERKQDGGESSLNRVRDSRFNLDHCIATLRAHYVELAGSSHVARRSMSMQRRSIGETP